MQCSLLMNADLDTQSVLTQIMEEAKALVGAEIAGHVATTGDAVIVPDAYSDPRFSNAMDVRTGFRTRNIMCVPLKSKKDGIIGVVQLINKTDAGVLIDGRRRASIDFSGQRKASRCSSDFTADMILSDMQSSDATIAGSSSGESDFTGDDLQFLQVFASQAAIAIASSGALKAERDETQPGATPSATASEAEEGSEVPKYRTRDGQELDEACCQIKGATVTAEVLGQASQGWYLDSQRLNTTSNNQPLSTLGCHLFEHLGLVASLGLDQKCVAEFFQQIEAGYDSTI